MNTLNRNFRIVYVPLRRAKWPKDSRPSSPRVHTKGDHVLEMRRASYYIAYSAAIVSTDVVSISRASERRVTIDASEVGRFLQFCVIGAP